MKARQLIDGASFGPDTLKVVTQAFDEAWSSVAANYGDDPRVIAAARLLIAHAILSVADEDSSNVEVLKNAALYVIGRGLMPTPPAAPPNRSGAPSDS